MRLDSVLYRLLATDFRFLLREEVVEGEASSSKGDDDGALDKVSVGVWKGGCTFTVHTCTCKCTSHMYFAHV